MEIENVVSAKALWFMDMRKLNPRGRNLYKVVTPQLMQWYGFSQPREPFDEISGVHFIGGEFSPTQDERSGDLTGVSVTVYFNGLLAQTQTTTDDSERFLEQALNRLSREGHITFHTSFIKNKRYQSELVVRATHSIKLPEFPKFCATLTKMAYPDSNDTLFNTSGIIFDTDLEPLGSGNRKRPQFTFERKVDVSWSENLYYSQAPLETSRHADALNELEQLLLA